MPGCIYSYAYETPDRLFAYLRVLHLIIPQDEHTHRLPMFPYRDMRLHVGTIPANRSSPACNWLCIRLPKFDKLVSAYELRADGKNVAKATYSRKREMRAKQELIKH